MEQTTTDIPEVTETEFAEAMNDESESGRSVSPDKANRFYDRIRKRISDYVDSKGSTLGKTAEYLLLVPDFFILLWRLIQDARVAGKDKVLLGSAVAYYIFPFDIIPEGFLGPIGYLDDLVFAVYVLNHLLTDVDAQTLRDHWSGSEDVLDSIRRVMNAADQLVGSEMLEKIKKFIK